MFKACPGMGHAKLQAERPAGRRRRRQNPKISGNVAGRFEALRAKFRAGASASHAILEAKFQARRRRLEAKFSASPTGCRLYLLPGTNISGYRQAGHRISQANFKLQRPHRRQWTMRYCPRRKVYHARQVGYMCLILTVTTIV